jgi:hypothetical protein
MDSSRVIWPLVCAIVTSALGIFVGYFVERFFIHRRPFAEKVDETMRRISLVGRAYRVEWRQELPPITHLSRDANKAIGLGLITREEVSAIGSDSLSKSNLSFGLILPLSLFLYAVAFRLQFHTVGFSGVVFFVLLSNAALVVVGFERLYSYKWELQSLILGRLEKQQVDRMEGEQKR